MKFNTRLQIEKIASPKDTRQYCRAPYFDAEGSRIIATDGHKAVIVPVTECEDDTGGHIPAEAFAAARKAKYGGLFANGTVNVGAVSFQRPEPIPFPEIDRALPAADAVPVMTVSFNAEYLLQLAKAISDKRLPIVKLEIFDANSAMRVTASGSDAIGFLMPCRF